MPSLAMLVLPGAFHGGVAAMLDGFALAGERRARVVQSELVGEAEMSLTVLSPDGAAVTLGNRVLLQVDGPIATTDRFDHIAIPAFVTGGLGKLRQRLANSVAVVDWLARQSRQGSVISASGSAVALPVAAGLTKGMAVPVVPALQPVFREMFPRTKQEEHREIVEKGNLILGRGISSDHELVARAFDRVLSPATGHWLRSVLGRSIETRHEAGGDPLVETARLWLEQRFAGPVSIAALANELHVSHPVLIRRFRMALGKTPSQYVRDLRITTAKRLLTGTTRKIDSIAAAVGYNDARNFREMFRQETGKSASEWRAEKSNRRL